MHGRDSCYHTFTMRWIIGDVHGMVRPLETLLGQIAQADSHAVLYFVWRRSSDRLRKRIHTQCSISSETMPTVVPIHAA
jgi:hypothetical protein